MAVHYRYPESRPPAVVHDALTVVKDKVAEVTTGTTVFRHEAHVQVEVRKIRFFLEGESDRMLSLALVVTYPNSEAVAYKVVDLLGGVPFQTTFTDIPAGGSLTISVIDNTAEEPWPSLQTELHYAERSDISG